MNDRRYGREHDGGRMRRSIVRRMSSRLFWRLLGLFISLNITICSITAVSLCIYSERRVLAAAQQLSAAGAPDADAAGWLSLTGLRVHETDDLTGGFAVPEPLQFIFPKETAASRRAVQTTAPGGADMAAQSDNVYYIVYLEAGGNAYETGVFLGSFMRIFRRAFTALMIIELLTLLTKSLKDRRMVRRLLAPISDLAHTAQSLGDVTSRLDPEKMAAFAAGLEGIGPDGLDARIQIDETQEELRKLAVAINCMLDRITDSYRAQVRFVSDASHELRTPISVIQGYANMLDRWGKNDEKTLEESISAIRDEAAGMKDLVEQLLFLARGDNNTIVLDIRPFSLSELAEEVVAESRMIDVSHRFELQAGEGTVPVSADRALIKQALRILVDNAIKYSDAGGVIKVSVSREGAMARAGVSDTGIGIKPEVIPHIFDRFYRADESRARATGGAGLGLSIANWIAARHGGHMDVLSREGLGTRVSLSLPAGAEPPAAPAPPAASS